MSGAVLADPGLVCAYGRGIDATWQGLMSGGAAIREVDRFPTAAHPCRVAALAANLAPDRPDSLVRQMLDPLLRDLAPAVPRDADLLLATTTGEIDLLERCAADDRADAAPSRPERLLRHVRATLGLTGAASVVSAACASSTAALAQAAERVARNPRAAVLVVACDAVTEFVFAGFSALMALDPQGARPFDRDRKGLTLGDAAAAVLVMDAERARAEGRRPVARMTGWGLSCDANHMTGPAQDGNGLARAMRLAIERAGAADGDIGSVCAHGTGTPYNDAMELKALRTALPGRSPRVYSVKGGLGHTLGAAGLVETLIAAESLRCDTVPPTVGLSRVDAEAEGLVPGGAAQPAGPLVLSTNSGFGGINAALVLARGDG